MARSGVYLLHFTAPYRHARHYVGWSPDIDARLATHAAGHGARLLAVVREAGIGWELARVWPGASRSRERQLKNTGGASRYCPLCGVCPRATRPDKATVREALERIRALSEAWSPEMTPTEVARTDAEIRRLSALIPPMPVSPIARRTPSAPVLDNAA